MRKAEFRNYLSANVTDSRRRISNYLSYCKKIEDCEHIDLDEAYRRDGMAELFERLQYSTEDARNNIPPRHIIPISGDIRTVTSSYKNALKTYKNFIESGFHGPAEQEPAGAAAPAPAAVPAAAAPRGGNAGRRNPPRDWPQWEHCAPDEMYEAAKILVPYIRFLNPAIIKAITENNQQNRNRILSCLSDAGIVCPERYLWDGSSCAFPGVRRKVGQAERKGAWRWQENFVENPNEHGTALYLDDNDAPKQIWAYTFTGSYFRKIGPAGYSLAHLIDHKLSKNRMWDNNEPGIPGEFENAEQGAPLYGLFSCPSNSVYICNELMKPTDFNSDLRKLIISKAFQLYGDCCNLLPEGIELRAPADRRFTADNPEFRWAEPVGSTDNKDAFFAYRKLFYAQQGYEMFE